MQTSAAGINLIKRYEGCRLAAYKCPAGIWTIGYGHTAGVKKGQVITQAQADILLLEDVKKFEEKVNKYYNIYTWKQHEFDALVSFAFNLGSIDQLTANGTRDRQTIAEKIILYNKAGTTVLAGLTRRRKEEQALFLNGLIGNSAEEGKSTEHNFPTIRKGDKNHYVKVLQLLLEEKELSVGKSGADGIFGTNTQLAVITYQAEQALKQDGIAGKNTWGRLLYIE